MRPRDSLNIRTPNVQSIPHSHTNIHSHELVFFEARLDEFTASLLRADSFAGVCAFVNDDLSAPVIDKLVDAVGGLDSTRLSSSGHAHNPSNRPIAISRSSSQHGSTDPHPLHIKRVNPERGPHRAALRGLQPRRLIAHRAIPLHQALVCPRAQLQVGRGGRGARGGAFDRAAAITETAPHAHLTARTRWRSTPSPCS